MTFALYISLMIGISAGGSMPNPFEVLLPSDHQISN
jgi:hypothetical protein